MPPSLVLSACSHADTSGHGDAPCISMLRSEDLAPHSDNAAWFPLPAHKSVIARQRSAFFLDFLMPWGAASAPPMTIDSIQMPSADKLKDFASDCKIDVSNLVNDSPHKRYGESIVQASRCAESAGDAIVAKIFGTALRPDSASTDVGVHLQNSSDIPMGSMTRSDLESAKDGAHSFGTGLLRQFGHKEVPVGEASHASPPVISAIDASNALRRYGLALEGMGDSMQMQACKLGRLQTEGTSAAQHICAEVEGPPPESPLACTIL